MAVVMEVVWRPSGGDHGPQNSPTGVLDGMRSAGSQGSQKRAWGSDTEKLMQFMMGHFTTHGVEGEAEKSSGVLSTLDLLGTAGGGGGGGGGGVVVSEEGLESGVDEFLEVDPDQPLPSGWEQCLDIKTGELYFVNKTTGMRTSEDPRKYQREAEALAVMGGVIAPRTPARPAHEFLASKKEEALRASTSSGSSGEDAVTTNNNKPPAVMPQLLSFATGKRLWSLQLDDRDRTTMPTINKTTTSWSNSPRAPSFPNSRDESNLELNLNLSPSRLSPSPPPLSHTQTVCTMEMVQQALKRTEKAMGKREATTTSTTTLPPPLSASSSFSSLAEPSWSRSSPSTSTSSTSKAAAPDIESTKVSEAESGAAPVELQTGMCMRCFMLVMVNPKCPKCPRCESEVGLGSFSSAVPSAKRQRVQGPTVLQ